MSVARARDLLQRLASDPDLASQIENAPTRQAMRAIVNQAGFGDVSAEDVLQAIGSDVVQGIAGGQSLVAAGAPDAARERIYLLAAKAGDGAPAA
jgi:predicted ribosomally synthesized peptide with nif11-like leader